MTGNLFVNSAIGVICNLLFKNAFGVIGKALFYIIPGNRSFYNLVSST